MKKQNSFNFFKNKKGDITLSLNQLIGLVIGAILMLSIVFFIINLWSVFNVEEEESMSKGFYALHTQIEDNEKNILGNINQKAKMPLNIFIKSDYIIIPFSQETNLKVEEGYYSKYTSRCKNEDLVYYFNEFLFERAVGLGKQRLLNFFRDDEVEVEIIRDLYKCPASQSCLCLCKLSDENDKQLIDCKTEASCLPINGLSQVKEGGDYIDNLEKHQLLFKGNENGEQTCDFPMIYSKQQKIALFCIHTENNKISFEPGSCLS